MVLFWISYTFNGSHSWNASRANLYQVYIDVNLRESHIHQDFSSLDLFVATNKIYKCFWLHVALV